MVLFRPRVKTYDEECVRSTKQRLTQWFKAAFEPFWVILGPAPECGRREVKMVKNLKNFCNFFNSLLLHTAEHRLELPLPPCCCPPPFWLSPASLLALPCFPKYFFSCLLWSVVLLFTS